MSYWKQKLPLEKVLAGQFDGRTKTGLKRCIERLAPIQAHQTQLGLLINYQKLVVICEALQAENIRALPRDDMTIMLNKLAKEKVEMPLGVQKALLTKDISSMLNSKRYTDFTDLVSAMNPFTDSGFDPHQPTLGGLRDGMAYKVAQYKKIMFEAALRPMIAAGGAGSAKTKEFIEACLSGCEGIDIVELCPDSAVALQHWTEVWHAVLTIIDPTQAMEYEAPCHPLTA